MAWPIYTVDEYELHLACWRSLVNLQILVAPCSFVLCQLPCGAFVCFVPNGSRLVGGMLQLSWDFLGPMKEATSASDLIDWSCVASVPASLLVPWTGELRAQIMSVWFDWKVCRPTACSY